MDLKQQYPRSSSFNQLKNPLNINSLIFSRHANCLVNLRNCPMEMTLSSSHFFPPYDYHQTAQMSFIRRAVLQRYIAALKNCVTWGVGVLPTMHYTGRLRKKGVPFLGVKHSLASISYLKDSTFTAVKGMER